MFTACDKEVMTMLADQVAVTGLSSTDAVALLAMTLTLVVHSVATLMIIIKLLPARLSRLCNVIKGLTSVQMLPEAELKIRRRKGKGIGPNSSLRKTA